MKPTPRGLILWPGPPIFFELFDVADVIIVTMKKRLVYLIAAFSVLLISAEAGRADQFDRIANSPYTYWVPAPTPPPPAYASAPPSAYYGPPPAGYYYGPPPPPPGPLFFLPRFFIGFHFH